MNIFTKLNHPCRTLLLSIVLALAASAGCPATAAADWGPGQIAVEGELTNLAGEPIPGPVNLQFFIYPAPDAANPLWNETHKAVALEDGRFQVVLGETVPLDEPPLFENYADLWIGLSVNGGEELPTVPLTSIGYSMQAKHAEVCEELAEPPDNLVCTACVADSEVTFNYAGSDSKGGAALDVKCAGCVAGSDILDASVELADLAASGCAAGNIIKRNAGGTAWACEKDQVLGEAEVDAFVANNGYALAASLAKIATTGAWTDLLGIPDSIKDGDDNTTYGPGPGLKLDGTIFSLDTTGCTAGELLKRNGDNTAWECVPDVSNIGDVTSVNAGVGLTGGGQSGDVTLSADKPAIESWAKGVCYDSQAELDPLFVGEGQPSSISSVMLVEGAVTDSKITDVSWGKIKNVPPGFADGTDADSGGDITAVVVGAGLKGGGSSGSVTVEADKPVIETWAKGVCYDTPGELTGTLDATYVNVGEPNSISSAMIIDGTVGSDDIGDGTVGAADIADGSVGAAEIADGSVGAAEIADGSVGAAEIADNSVGTAEIQNGSIVDADVSATAAIAYSKLSGVAAASHTHAASQVTAGTFSSGTYEFNTASTVNMNAKVVVTACPTGYTLRAANLCVSNSWHAQVTFNTAQQDCFDEGAHVCTYAEIYHAWASGNKPSIADGDWLGDVVGDDSILCINSTTNMSNFDGSCDKNNNRYYFCCIRGGYR